MSLKLAIDEIIRQRKAKAADFNRKKETYTSIKTRVEKIVKAIKSIDANNTDVIELLGADFLNALNDINPSKFYQKYNELVAMLDEVQSLYMKEEINISVIGAARQGKSTLLQSISGLDNNVIPAFDSTDCTGAISIIRNVDGASVSAKVYFYNKEQMLEIINRYITQLAEDTIPPVENFSDIPNVDIYKIKNRLLSAQSSDIEKWNQLEKYVRYFDTWSPLVEHYGTIGSCLSIEDSNEIIKYVAQHNGKPNGSLEREEYFNYLAVSKVEISCQFNYKDAGRIVLRDTIGLGDARMIGLTESMLSAIAGDCDAAIVIKRPRDNTDNMREDDYKLYEVLKKSCEHRHLDMNRWFFYVINHMKGRNEEGCNNVLNQLNNNHLAMAGAYIADASNEEEVTNNVIVPLLTKLRENLPVLDKDREDNVRRVANEVFDEYEALYRACQRANTLCHVDANWRRRISGEAANIFTNAANAFGKLKSSYSAKKMEECAELMAAVRSLAPNIGGPNSPIPSKEQIQLFLERGGANADRTTVMHQLLHKLRNDFTAAFVKMDEILNELAYKLQSEVASLLAEQMNFNKLVGMTPDELLVEMKAEYLDNLRRKKLQDQDRTGFEGHIDESEADCLNGKQYGAWISKARTLLSDAFFGEEFSNLWLALDFMANFNISVRSFLLPRIRACINTLDPNINTQPDLLVISMTQQATADVASLMRDILIEVYINAYDTSSNLIVPLYKEPNNLLYSAIAEFTDRIIYSFTIIDGRLMDAEDIWNTIYNSDTGVSVFYKNLYIANKKAQELKEEFTRMAAERLSRDEFFDVR